MTYIEMCSKTWTLTKTNKHITPFLLNANKYRNITRKKQNVFFGMEKLVDFYQPTFETAMAVELNKRLDRSSSVIASLLRFGERMINSRRPYQWDKYLKMNDIT
jgi:hypothetical protein